LSETKTLETTIRHPAKSRQSDRECCPRGLPVLKRVLPVLCSCAVLVLAAMLARVPVAGAQIQLPDFGDSSSNVFSRADEKAIGEAFMRAIRSNLTVIDDPEVEQYIQWIGYRIVSESDYQNIGFTFFVLADDAINAFAAPGGYIGVNSGLITASDSESELASVLAHESAHVTQRHIARSIELADRTNIPAIAGLIAAIIIGTQNSQAGAAAAAAVAGGRAQKQIDFTRANEKEADRVGMQLLENAGFDPRAMPSFFEKLQSASRYYRRPPEFLSSHPVTTSRIADTRGRAERYPYRQYRDGLSYSLVKAKLRARLEFEPKEAVRYFRDLIDDGRYSSLPAAKYGLAISLERAGRPREANEILRELVKKHPDRMSFRAALGENEFRAGDLNEALRIFAEGLGVFPDNKILIRGYAKALIQAGQGRRALDVVESYGRLHDLDAALYRIRAQAFQLVGNSAESHISLAEHYYQNGELGAAIHQLELASRVSDNDFYRSSRIEARLQELETEKILRAQR
jgi:predicted Zn-dependent protease